MAELRLADKKNVGITPKQKAFMTFIHEFSQDKGYAPSQQEIANHFGWRSLGTVQDYLKILSRKGLLEKKNNYPRTLEINSSLVRWIPNPGDVQDIAVVGKIAAGKPIEAIEAVYRPALSMPASMVPGGDLYALEVEGTSMVEDGIMPGDFIIVKKQAHAQDGETVVALVKKEATVKRIYRHKKQVELRPANSQMDSIWVDDCQVQGVVVALYRRYA